MQRNNTQTPSRPSRRRRRATYVAAALALVAVSAGCGGDDGSTGASGDPTVEIAAPAAGSQVPESFEVTLDPSFQIGEPDTGRQHIHLHYDGSSEYDIVYEETHRVTSLDPGEHRIVAVVANADHSETDSRSEEVTVEVTDGGQSGTGPTVAPPTTPSDDGPSDGEFDY